MLRRGVPLTSLIFCLRQFPGVMSSQANGSQSPCHCRKSHWKSPITRAASSCYEKNDENRVIDKSGDRRSRERGELLWEKLSEDEKNIYLAHKTACMATLVEVITLTRHKHRRGCVFPYFYMARMGGFKDALLGWLYSILQGFGYYIYINNSPLNGENGYLDPVTGYMVFTEEFLSKRKTCCGNGCRHCPFGHENVPHSQRKKKFNSAFYV